MQVIHKIEKMQRTSSEYFMNGKTIGFVPTMGYLHEGHLQLIKEARKQNDIVILSIFVNPLQFGAGEDLDTYPRDEERDMQLAEENGVDVVFLPSRDTMYPQPLSLSISVDKRADVLCGRSRPGHFEGVVTVLTKLFNICQPTKAYFGLKDAQQLAVVDALIQDFNFPIELVGVATIRENDGLAKSSRNVRLSQQERKEAPFIQKALKKGNGMVADGTKNPAQIVKETKKFLESQTHGRIDYVELLSYPELEPVKEIDRQVILAAAVNYQQARLIDNVIFDETGTISQG
ncbi:pantoate--beta-alanine ligase [Halobacillus salinarum]|uniref:Pantothenate synthetase n=1 Tax=Halobacillus salinarum TaxID=2932257 RepID=A0ABY4EE44_9BACI|nr:pantoate--beta-alanine ligase [Halobacillus salinarum]UOQ42735.1 pantoate--beta-alanine ligase [Halobacillus salinarum]